MGRIVEASALGGDLNEQRVESQMHLTHMLMNSKMAMNASQKHAPPSRFASLPLHFFVLCQNGHGLIPALSQLLVPKGIPAALPLHHIYALCCVQHAAQAGDATAKHDVKFCNLVRRRTLVLHNLPTG